MKLSHLTTSILAAGFLISCAQAESAVEKTAQTAAAKTSEAAQKTGDTLKEAAKKTTDAAKSMKPSAPGADISEAPSGTYKAEAGHAYIAFSYDHQGYSKPILRWGEFDGTVELNSEAPEKSSVSVTIPVASIDSGVDVFNDHLKSAGFFDVETYPTITFKSTEINQIITGSGQLTGDLTIKGVTKPITLNVKLNKVGQNFRSGVDMFGISATGSLKRADYGLDKYLPVAEYINLMIEVEFQKEG
ncbi:MAG: YceI family protein [Hellea sp.]